jgi:hypothetical protein
MISVEAIYSGKAHTNLFQYEVGHIHSTNTTQLSPFKTVNVTEGKLKVS